MTNISAISQVGGDVAGGRVLSDTRATDDSANSGNLSGRTPREGPSAGGDFFARKLGLRASRQSAAALLAKAQGTRALALQIRRMHPDVGQTSYEAAKVSSNAQATPIT